MGAPTVGAVVLGGGCSGAPTPMWIMYSFDVGSPEVVYRRFTVIALMSTSSLRARFTVSLEHRILLAISPCPGQQVFSLFAYRCRMAKHRTAFALMFA